MMRNSMAPVLVEAFISQTLSTGAVAMAICVGLVGRVRLGEGLRGYTAVVPPIPCSAADPPVFFSQSVLRQPSREIP